MLDKWICTIPDILSVRVRPFFAHPSLSSGFAEAVRVGVDGQRGCFGWRERRYRRPARTPNARSGAEPAHGK